MLDREFEVFLMDDENITSKTKAVQTRLSKAHAVEKALNISLDSIVDNDISMYRALMDINVKFDNKKGAYSNALRKYYSFKNHKLFPQLDTFARQHKNEL